MIKVFSSSNSPDSVGDVLTKMYEDWEKSLEFSIKVKKVECSSNNYGWLMIVIYEQNIETDRWK